jgi:hypothetical protein
VRCWFGNLSTCRREGPACEVTTALTVELRRWDEEELVVICGVVRVSLPPSGKAARMDMKRH